MVFKNKITRVVLFILRDWTKIQVKCPWDSKRHKNKRVCGEGMVVNRSFFNRKYFLILGKIKRWAFKCIFAIRFAIRLQPLLSCQLLDGEISQKVLELNEEVSQQYGLTSASVRFLQLAQRRMKAHYHIEKPAIWQKRAFSDLTNSAGT